MTTLADSIRSRLLVSLAPKKPPAILAWAKQNIVIPSGPHRGRPFDENLQPFSRLFLTEIDNPRWERVVSTGPSQTGKSLNCYVIPVLFHLFAIEETVIGGLPTADIADDKWNMDFLPVIEASPTLRELLPTKGPGSRSGKVRTRVKFRNGSTFRFMSFGGDDKSVAGFTSRVLAVTEVDAVDKASETSKEADKLKQLEARLRAYLAFGIREYLECTVTTSEGTIWREYLAGTRSKIARPCPHCRQYVTPEREHLKGWQDADTEEEARQNSRWHCPACDQPWSEAQRREANSHSVLVHHGQEIDELGTITGPEPGTRTLSFRWTAVDNHFARDQDIAADEWQATREHDRENAEKELRQFVHCLPYDPPDIELTPLDPGQVCKRAIANKKGIVPEDCTGVTVGVDTGKRALHWCAIAWRAGGGGQIIEYGVQTVESDKLGVKSSLLIALRDLSRYLARGWQTVNGQAIGPSQVWIDSGYHEHQEPVFDFCREINTGLPLGAERYRPSKGYGEGQRRLERYYAPKKINQDVRYIAPGYHLAKSRSRTLLVHINSDHWKSELHQRLSQPTDSPTAIVLYEAADANEHRDFAQQLTAERQMEKWDEARGEMIVWERMRRQNHYLDAAYSATAAGHFLLSLKPNSAPTPAAGSWFAQQQRR